MKKEIVVLLILSGCGSSFQQKKKIAQSHYRQASLEVREYQEKESVNSLRKALNEIEKAIEIHQTSHALGLKGTILLQLGCIDQSKQEIKESLPYFERVFKDKNTTKARRADAKNNYATALYQLGKNKEAIAIWNELKTNSHYISPEVAFFNLGYAELNEAIRLQQQKNDSKEAEHHLENAVTCFRQSLAVSKEYIDALLFLTQALVGLKKLTEAHDTCLTILTINPDHQTALRWLKSIEERLNK